jgi:hypothetical protein
MKLRAKVACLLIPLCAGLIQASPFAPGGRAEDGSRRAVGAAAQVSGDSLEAMVRFLTIDPTAGTLRSRFVFREAELGEVADSLSSRLERYIGSPVDRITFTIRDSTGEYSDDSTFTAENIVGRLEGTGASTGVLLITAHYDAIATRSTEEDWRANWDILPAPGADDNASGVAAVMEAARILSDYSLPFDVMFVLFSGEELGLLGSEDFVERYDALYGDEILGVYNIDMLGWPVDETPEGAVMTDLPSGWLADLLLDSIEFIDPLFPLRICRAGFSNYDHASFWLRSIPAVSLTEPLSESGFVLNPYYHTLRDTIGWIDFEQTRRITQILVGTVARFAEPAVEVQILPSDLQVYRGPVVTNQDLFDSGDSITVRVAVRNSGGGMPPAGSALTLRISIESNTGIHSIHFAEMEPPAPLHAVVAEIPLVVGERFAGGNRVIASFTVSGFEDDPSNNGAIKSFSVEGAAEVLLMHGFQPNPIRTVFSQASFCINLSGEANMVLEIFTIEGERIDRAFIGSGYGVPVQAGLNCIGCGALFPGVERLVSGVYPYRLTLFGSGGAPRHFTGRFAIEN